MGIVRVITFDSPGNTYHIPNDRGDAALCGVSTGPKAKYCSKEFALEEDRTLCGRCAKKLEKIDQARELRSRIGRFKVSLSLLHESPHSMMKIFGEMVILEASGHWYETVEYVALCDKFEKIEEGQKAPEYEIIVTTNKGENSWTVQKVQSEKY